jgi:hypothetical protein
VGEVQYRSQRGLSDKASSRRVYVSGVIYDELIQSVQGWGTTFLDLRQASTMVPLLLFWFHPLSPSVNASSSVPTMNPGFVSTLAGISPNHIGGFKSSSAC